VNYDQALTIAAQNAKDLIVDPPRPAQPNLFAVRKTKTGAPFSIHLPTSIDPNHTPADALAAETEMLIHSLSEAQRLL
jgi:hypothetical protein